ncbi:WD40-repeat-containing domain protein [Nemania serpens]|nr:WD40-repeat-containing domain protein [Nemania serpens]
MCLQIYGDFLVTGSYDASIRLWNLSSGSLVRTFLGHTAGIRALQFDSSKIVSGSLDETIKIWNWQTGQCLLTISNHNGALVGLDLSGKILASSSMDKTIKIWNFEDKEASTLRGHKDGVNSVSMDTASRTLISASDDFTLRLWDLDTKQCIRVFEGHCGQVQQALFSPVATEYSHLLELSPLVGHPHHQKDTQLIRSSYGSGFSACPERSLPPLYVISGSLDNTLRLWNTASGDCVRVDFGHTEGVWTVAMDSLRVVSGAGDSLAKVWDLITGTCQSTLTGHTGPVTCIGLTDSILATGSDDCRVVVYNFKPDEI